MGSASVPRQSEQWIFGHEEGHERFSKWWPEKYPMQRILKPEDLDPTHWKNRLPPPPTDGDPEERRLAIYKNLVAAKSDRKPPEDQLLPITLEHDTESPDTPCMVHGTTDHNTDNCRAVWRNLGYCYDYMTDVCTNANCEGIHSPRKRNAIPDVIWQHALIKAKKWHDNRTANNKPSGS